MNESPQAQSPGRYASVNGVHLYYEIHGSGSPLVLLGGGFMTVDTVGPLLPALAQTRQVIAVELQAHGHTADVARPLRYEHMADDIGALIAYLELGAADVFGYSLGGGVALQTAIRHPDAVRKLVVMSATYQRAGWFPEDLAGMAAINADFMATTPLGEAYRRVASRPEDWTTLVAKMVELLGQDYDWSADVAEIKAPTLIVVGDADGVRLAHAVEMFALLGGARAQAVMAPLPSSQLAVLPGTTHLSIITRTDLLLPILTPFLDATLPETT